MSSSEYPEELVELVRHAALKALANGGEHAIGPAVLGALAGRLVPEGSEVEWRVRYPTLGRVSLPLGPMPESLIRETAEQAKAGGLEAIVESRIVTPWTPAESVGVAAQEQDRTEEQG